MLPTVLRALPVALLLAAASAAAPNVLLVVADDLGYGDLGYTGSDVKTPVIDALATEGRVLSRYYVNIVCSPTRAMLLTGRYNIRYGLQTQVIPNDKQYGLPLNETILPQYLKRAGYATHAIGKWHLGLWHWGYTPTWRGFDTFLGYYSGSQDYFTHKDAGYDFRLDVGPNCGADCSKSVAAQYAGNYSTESGRTARAAPSLLVHHEADRAPLEERVAPPERDAA